MTAWSAYVEYAATDVPEEAHDLLLDFLAQFSVVTTTSVNGNLGIVVTVDEPTAERAITEALELTGDALRRAYGACKVVGLELMTTEEQDRRNSEPSIPELAGRAQVAKILDVSPQRADQIMQTKRFQQYVRPATVVGGRPLFVADHVRGFLEVRRGTSKAS